MRIMIPILLLSLTTMLFSQGSNVTLFGQIDTFPGRSSGSWGYVSSSGAEFALIGEFGGTSIVAIDDQQNIQEVAFIAGPPSNWREIVVLGDYAYVTSEGEGPLAGMQVIDLSSLPNGATLATTYTTGFTSAHIIARDIYSSEPYVYVMGSGGVRIIDVSNPLQPVQIGAYNPFYIHDAHVRGDRVYAAALNQGLHIVDISNRSNPVLLRTLVYPAQFTHSSWTTEDHRHIMVTDEQDGLVARIWNIENLNNIEQVASYSANLASLVHNPYILGDLAFLSHNTEGLRVVDIADPSLPVEVGFYDTYAGPSGGFSGLWSAYPFLPSGKILGANREDGLYIWEFNGTRAARIYGTVIDSLSGLPVPGADVRLDPGGTVTAGSEGGFRFGVLPGSSEGPFRLTVMASGYHPRSIDLVLNQGDSLALEIRLLDNTVGLGDGTGAAPADFQISQNYPNPFNPSTVLPFYLPVASPVKVEIYDIGGRLIRRLANQQFAAGWHRLNWDGTDERREAVGSGTYFYRIESRLGVRSGRMTLIR